MEQDKELKNLLTKVAFEETSSAFTDKVMRRIEATEIYKSSFINPVFKRTFVPAFVIVLIAVLIITFLIKPADFPFLQFIKLPEITPAFFKKTIMYVSLFWLLILINYVTERAQLNRSHQKTFQQ